MTRALNVVLASAGALAAAYLGVSLFVALRFTAPETSEPDPAPEPSGLPAREVSFDSEDGVRLEGWWVEGGSGRAVILVHGWGGSRSEEHVLRTAAIYADRGYAVLMPDLRGHGGSQKVRRTLGNRERSDVRAALSWVEARGFAPGDTVLHGFSMGAATVVDAAPGAGVAAIISESGYADLPHLLEGSIPAVAGLPRLFTPGILFAARVFLGLDAREVRPADAARLLARSGVPLFVIHSTTDEVVPYEHTRLFKAAYPGAEFWRLEGYDHVEAYTHPGYKERLLEFLSKAAPE